MPQELIGIEDASIQQRDIVRPKGVIGGALREIQELDRRRDGLGHGIFGLRENVDETILGNGATSPTEILVCFPPLVHTLVVYVVGLEQSDEYVDVE